VHCRIDTCVPQMLQAIDSHAPCPQTGPPLLMFFVYISIQAANDSLTIRISMLFVSDALTTRCVYRVAVNHLQNSSRSNEIVLAACLFSHRDKSKHNGLAGVLVDLAVREHFLPVVKESLEHCMNFHDLLHVIRPRLLIVEELQQSLNKQTTQ
jgi:hypothetical protein